MDQEPRFGSLESCQRVLPSPLKQTVSHIDRRRLQREHSCAMAPRWLIAGGCLPGEQHGNGPRSRQGFSLQRAPGLRASSPQQTLSASSLCQPRQTRSTKMMSGLPADCCCGVTDDGPGRILMRKFCMHKFSAAAKLCCFYFFLQKKSVLLFKTKHAEK